MWSPQHDMDTRLFCLVCAIALVLDTDEVQRWRNASGSLAGQNSRLRPPHSWTNTWTTSLKKKCGERGMIKRCNETGEQRQQVWAPYTVVWVSGVVHTLRSDIHICERSEEPTNASCWKNENQLTFSMTKTLSRGTRMWTTSQSILEDDDEADCVSWFTLFVSTNCVFHNSVGFWSVWGWLCLHKREWTPVNYLCEWYLVFDLAAWTFSSISPFPAQSSFSLGNCRTTHDQDPAPGLRNGAANQIHSLNWELCDPLLSPNFRGRCTGSPCASGRFLQEARTVSCGYKLHISGTSGKCLNTLCLPVGLLLFGPWDLFAIGWFFLRANHQIIKCLLFWLKYRLFDHGIVCVGWFTTGALCEKLQPFCKIMRPISWCPRWDSTMQSVAPSLDSLRFVEPLESGRGAWTPGQINRSPDSRLEVSWPGVIGWWNRTRGSSDTATILQMVLRIAPCHFSIIDQRWNTFHFSIPWSSRSLPMTIHSTAVESSNSTMVTRSVRPCHLATRCSGCCGWCTECDLRRQVHPLWSVTWLRHHVKELNCRIDDCRLKVSRSWTPTSEQMFNNAPMKTLVACWQKHQPGGGGGVMVRRKVHGIEDNPWGKKNWTRMICSRLCLWDIAKLSGLLQQWTLHRIDISTMSKFWSNRSQRWCKELLTCAVSVAPFTAEKKTLLRLTQTRTDKSLGTLQLLHLTHLCAGCSWLSHESVAHRMRVVLFHLVVLRLLGQIRDQRADERDHTVVTFLIFVELGNERLGYRLSTCLQQLRARDANGRCIGDLVTHVDVNTMICAELSLRRSLVQLGRTELVQPARCEFVPLGRISTVACESDELFLLFLPDLQWWQTEQRTSARHRSQLAMLDSWSCNSAVSSLVPSAVLAITSESPSVLSTCSKKGAASCWSAFTRSKVTISSIIETASVKSTLLPLSNRAVNFQIKRRTMWSNWCSTELLDNPLCQHSPCLDQRWAWQSSLAKLPSVIVVHQLDGVADGPKFLGSSHSYHSTIGELGCQIPDRLLAMSSSPQRHSSNFAPPSRGFLGWPVLPWCWPSESLPPSLLQRASIFAFAGLTFRQGRRTRKAKTILTIQMASGVLDRLLKPKVFIHEVGTTVCGKTMEWNGKDTLMETWTETYFAETQIRHPMQPRQKNPSCGICGRFPQFRSWPVHRARRVDGLAWTSQIWHRRNCQKYFGTIHEERSTIMSSKEWSETDSHNEEYSSAEHAEPSGETHARRNAKKSKKQKGKSHKSQTETWAVSSTHFPKTQIVKFVGSRTYRKARCGKRVPWQCSSWRKSVIDATEEALKSTSRILPHMGIPAHPSKDWPTRLRIAARLTNPRWLRKRNLRIAWAVWTETRQDPAEESRNFR